LIKVEIEILIAPDETHGLVETEFTSFAKNAGAIEVVFTENPWLFTTYFNDADTVRVAEFKAGLSIFTDPPTPRIIIRQANVDTGVTQ